MLCIVFEGWFQCRLATDPDPTDEPRGVSGWTFAVAGEPDLDRIIRLQPEGTTSRLGGPPIGVAVSRVERNGNVLPDHVLLGAKVSLRSGPVFDGRNHIEADDGREPIRPFELVIQKEELATGRTHVENGIPGTPDGLADEMGPQMLEKRLTEAGVSDTERAALGKRISELQQNGIQIALFRLALPYRFEVNGVMSFADPQQTLKEAPDPSKNWPIEFFMGAWDADALCGYMRGQLGIAMRQCPSSP